jgi:predicted TPR repeat methyltransferase
MITPHFQSSGDLTADKRYSYAIDLLARGDAAAASDLLRQALELAPLWPAGWFQLGQALEAAGDRTAAIAALRRAADIDPDDVLGARLHVARLGAAPTPARPPAAYVRELFDGYAASFDHALVDTLGYRVPQLIARALVDARGGQAFAHGLDLGCGTGLMAAALRDHIASFDGIDLSPRMVEVARAKNLYATLEVADILDALRARPDGCHDLVTAADVFCYSGDLAPVVHETARVLCTGGLLAFSVERQEAGADIDYTLGESLRFRHEERYVAACVTDAGLHIIHTARESLRNDRGIPIEGLISVAIKRGPT